MFVRNSLPMTCLLWSVVTAAGPAVADHVGYGRTLALQSRQGNTVCTHWHDWSQRTNESRYRMISNGQDPFRPDNDYAHVSCVNQKDGTTLFRAPSPALTKILISSDEKYLIGLSAVKVWNPYQFVVYRMDGKLMSAVHVSSHEACLEQEAFQQIAKECTPQQIAKLTQRSFTDGKRVFVDYMYLDSPREMGHRLFATLDAKRCPSHLSPNIRETTTNWVYWYNEADPGLAVEYNDRGELATVMVNDPLGQRIAISILPQPK